MTVFTGTAGNDTLSGTSGDDTFNVFQGGDDNLKGFDGNDIFSFGATFTATDTVNGGAGNDTLRLNGDYSAGVTMSATTLTGVELVQVSAGHSYNLTTNDATVAPNQTLTVSGNALGAGDALTFDGSADINSVFVMTGGAGNDTLKGGARGDTFNTSLGGSDLVVGNGGNDIVNAGAALSATDGFNGGAGNDFLRLVGDYSAGVTLASGTLTSVEQIQLGAGFDYKFTITGESTAMTVNGDLLGAGDTMNIDASAEGAAFTLIGGAGDDVLAGGAGNDFIQLLHGGNDIVSGGAGTNVFNYGAAFTAADHLTGTGGNDILRLNGDYSAGVLLANGVDSGLKTFQFAGGNDYNLTVQANVFRVTPQAITIQGDTLGAGDSLTFDASAAGAGTVLGFVGGHGNDVLSGGVGADTFDLTLGGNDTVHGGDGADIVSAGNALTAADSIDGGAGSDTLSLNGNYAGVHALTLGAATISNVETVLLTAGNSYNLTTNDANVAAGQTLTIDARALASSFALTFNGAAETDGAFNIDDGAGNDVITGGAGGDTFKMFAALTAADQVNGGAGDDIVELNGAYAGLTLGATTLVNIDDITFDAGHSYNITTNDATVAAGQTLEVDGSALGAADSLAFNGAAETDGEFTFFGGAGNDTITGGAGEDDFNLSQGGNDTAIGGAGDETFVMGAALNAADHIDGGADENFVTLSGDYTGANALVLGATTLTNILEITLLGGFGYAITTNDGNVAAGNTLHVDATAAGSLVFDGSAETDGAFNIQGTSGSDTITGGAGADSFSLNLGGNDTAHGGGGNDTINMGGSLNASDAIDGGAGSDTVNLEGNYSAALTLTSAMLTSVETLQLDSFGVFNFNLVAADNLVASGQTMTIDATGVTTGNTLSFDATAESDGGYAVSGGAGNITFILGTPTAFTNSTFAGGSGSNTLELNGDFTAGVTLDSTRMFNLNEVALAGGHGYAITVGAGEFTNTGAHTLTFADFGSVTSEAINAAANSTDSFIIDGSAGNDFLIGGQQGDVFVFAFSAGSSTFDSGDSVSGQGGNDTLQLNGDYSAGLSITGAMLGNVEEIQLEDGHSYNLTTADAVVGSGKTMTLDASALTGTNALAFNGSAETNGAFIFLAGAGADTLTGGAGADMFSMGANLTAADTINGGGGADTVEIGGANYTLTFGAATMTNVETLKLDAFHSYNLTTNDATVGSGQTLTVDGSAVTDALVFNGSAETNGSFAITSNTGGGTLTGGAGADSFTLNSGGFTVTGGGGADFISDNPFTTANTFVYNAVSDSTSVNYDHINGVNFGTDTFHVSGINGAVTGVDSAVTTGALSTATFDSDLAAAIGAGQLAAHTALLFTPDSGTLSGRVFLVVDENGTAGYQAGQDLVIWAQTDAGTLTTASFS